MAGAHAQRKDAGDVGKRARVQTIEAVHAAALFKVAHRDRIFAVGRQLRRQHGVRLIRIITGLGEHLSRRVTQDQDGSEPRAKLGRDHLKDHLLAGLAAELVRIRVARLLERADQRDG